MTIFSIGNHIWKGDNKGDNMEKSVRCDCVGGEHYLHFYAFGENGEELPIIYVDLNAREKLPFWLRVKEVIRFFKGQTACYDGIVLNKEKSEEIIEFLQDFWKRQAIEEKTCQ